MTALVDERHDEDTVVAQMVGDTPGVGRNLIEILELISAPCAIGPIDGIAGDRSGCAQQ